MIHINGGWYIDVDEHSYNLQQFAGYRTDKDGKEQKQWKNITYHATLDGAMIQFQRNQIREALAEKDMELSEAIEIVQTFNYMLKETVAKVLKMEKKEV